MFGYIIFSKEGKYRVKKKPAKTGFIQISQNIYFTKTLSIIALFLSRGLSLLSFSNFSIL